MDVRSRPRSLTLRPRRMGSSIRERGGEQRGGEQRTRERLAPERTLAELQGPEFEDLARSHRLGGPSQDQAVYSCSCGYVFEALVTTSVDCPHCGGPQAW